MGKNIRRFNDYEVNKAIKDAIVYQSATGNIYIRRDDLAAEQPKINEEFIIWLKEKPDSLDVENLAADEPKLKEEYFLWLKEKSDKVYHAIENSDHREHRNCYHDESYFEYEDETVIGFEEMIIHQEYLKETMPRLQAALNSLTPTQRRRILLLSNYGYSTSKIADIDNVSYVSVMRSINAAKKKMLNYLKDTGIKTT